jgi:hypothetical protein
MVLVFSKFFQEWRSQVIVKIKKGIVEVAEILGGVPVGSMRERSAREVTSGSLCCPAGEYRADIYVSGAIVPGTVHFE